MMTMSQIQEWIDIHATTPIAFRDSKGTEAMYINRVRYENGDTYEFRDVEGQGITVKINGKLVYKQ